MKAFTSLEQSKKLAKIMPIESADMHYNNVSIRGINYVDEYRAELMDYSTATQVLSKYSINPLFGIIPCWSLAALLSVLPIVYTNNKKEVCGPLHIDITDSETPFVLWYVNILHKGNIVELKTKEYDNMIDACYEMILKLKEEGLL